MDAWILCIRYIYVYLFHLTPSGAKSKRLFFMYD